MVSVLDFEVQSSIKERFLSKLREGIERMRAGSQNRPQSLVLPRLRQTTVGS
jgi:hypothetical protein